MRPRRPLRIVHVVCTDAFAGVERSVVLSTQALAARGHAVQVIGGSRQLMPSSLDGHAAGWTAASTIVAAVRALRQCSPFDVVHAHMTAAETAVLLAGSFRSSAFVTTRHFAARRGSSVTGRITRRAMSFVPHVEISISSFVAERIGCASMLVPHGIGELPAAPLSGNVAIMVQRLEAEKDSATALRAWAASCLPARGWRLLIAGDGAERPALEALTMQLDIGNSVEFLGYVRDTDALRACASIQIAPARSEHFGLSVLEAMACGLPVVAADAGAHPYLLNDDEPCLFEPGDAAACAARLDALGASGQLRRSVGADLQRRARRAFSIDRHGEQLEAVYRSALGERVDRPALVQPTTAARRVSTVSGSSGASAASEPGRAAGAAPSASPTTSHGSVPVPARQ